MTLNDQELAKIVRDRVPVTIDNKQFIVESNQQVVVMAVIF